jgi:hypothetical protein
MAIVQILSEIIAWGHKDRLAARCVGSCFLRAVAVIWGLTKLLHNFNEAGANPATPQEAAASPL